MPPPRIEGGVAGGIRSGGDAPDEENEVRGVHTLNPALSDTGVYAGTLLIGATIENSQTHRSGAIPAIGERPMPVVPARDLADHLWDMYTNRDRVEDVVAPALAGPANREEATQ